MPDALSYDFDGDDAALTVQTHYGRPAVTLHPRREPVFSFGQSYHGKRALTVECGAARVCVFLTDEQIAALSRSALLQLEKIEAENVAEAAQ